MDSHMKARGAECPSMGVGLLRGGCGERLGRGRFMVMEDGMHLKIFEELFERRDMGHGK
jgi:hypothetical protein